MKTGKALSTLCLIATLAACAKPEVRFKHLPIPAERIDAEPVAREDRPSIPPEYRIDWSKVETIEQARAEHDRFVASVRVREGVIAHYIIDLEGRVFACANDDKWIRDYQAGLEAEE